MNMVEYSKFNKDIHIYGGEIYFVEDKYYMVTVKDVEHLELRDMRHYRLCNLEDGRYWKDKCVEHMGIFYRSDFFERDMFGNDSDYYYVGNCTIKMFDAREEIGR